MLYLEDFLDKLPAHSDMSGKDINGMYVVIDQVIYPKNIEGLKMSIFGDHVTNG